MKIGFPVLKKVSTDALEFDSSLHGSRFFGVYDTIDKTVKIMPTNNENDESMGMDLIHFLKGEQVNYIISSDCHPMAARFFINNKIGLFKASGSNILKNIQLFMRNNLQPFRAENTSNSSVCLSSCTSCSTNCTEKIQDVISI